MGVGSKAEKIAFLVLLVVFFGMFSINSTIAEKESRVSDSKYFSLPESIDVLKTQIIVPEEFRIMSGEFEPDNSYANATSIEPNGTPQNHTLETGSDQDWVKFDATENLSYVIWTNNTTTGTDTYLRLYDTNGTALLGYNDDVATGNWNSRIVWYCPNTTTYYVKVNRSSYNISSQEGKGYNISINVTDPRTYSGVDSYEVDNNVTLATQIGTNKTYRNHSFYPYTNDEDYVKFDATDNTWYVIETMNTTNRTDSRLYLYDTDGVTVLNNATKTDDIGYPYNNNSRIFWKADATDTFYASDWDYWTKGGNYSIFVYTPNFTTAHTNGTTIPLTLSYTNSSYYINFSATSGKTYYIRTQNTTTGTDTYIQLYHENGTLLAENDDISYPSNRNSKLVWECTDTGTYYVLVSIFISGSTNFTISELGHIESDWIKPTSEQNVTKNGTFNVTFNVRCIDGYCGNVTATLDPWKVERTAEEKIFAPENVKSEKFKELNIQGTGEARYIVTLADQPDYSVQDMKTIKEQIKESQDDFINTFSNLKVERRYSSFNTMVVKATPEQAMQLANNPEVIGINPVQIRHIILDGSAQVINATQVWNQTDANGRNLTGQGQTVCIVDTGINYSHPNLVRAYLSGYDFANNDTNPMDDNGHGTHVSGIIASNDTNYRGIANGASVVMMKVCDSGGNCDDQAVLDGIQRCIDNKTAYNISVISMSLGGGAYNNVSACEADNTGYKNAFDAAVNAGIVVVVAAGNTAAGCNSTHMTAPGCVSSAISVGNTLKSDSVSGSSCSASFLSLLAPGTSITSTALLSGSACVNGSDFASCTGTSMATPHVAGAVAVMNQFYKAKFNTTLNRVQALKFLNDTGKRINDTRTGQNFTRIDIQGAIKAINNTKFKVPMNLGTPFYTTIQNPRYPSNLSCLRNMSNGSSCNLTWTVNATGDSDTIWEFYTVFESEFSQLNNESGRINLTITNENMAPQIFFNSPANNSLQNANLIVNVTIYSNTSLVKAARFRVENSSWNSSWTNLTLNDTLNDVWYGTFNGSVLSGGNYTVNVQANNSLNTQNVSYIIVSFDKTPPTLAILSTYPQNTSTPELNYTANDADLNTTWIVLDSGSSVIIPGNTTLNLTYPGRHSITLYVNDSFGNQNSTSLLFYENFPMNISKWNFEMFSHVPEAYSDSVYNLTNFIGAEEAANINTTLNVTIRFTDFNITFSGFNGLNAYWSNFFSASETDANVVKAVSAAGLNATKVFSMINASRFLSDGYYNVSIEIAPNSTAQDETFYCPNVSATFTDVGVDTHSSCNGPSGTIAGCYNTTSCYNITACPGGNYTGTACYKNSADFMTVYLPHFSAVATANDTPPIITVHTPQNTTYTTNDEVTNLNANITASSDTSVCKYSLNKGTNTSMTKSGNSFTASIGSPLLNKAHNITFYCNDTRKHANSTTVYFTIDDTTNPTLSTNESGIDKSSADIGVDTDEPVFGVIFYSDSSNGDNYVEAVDDTDCKSWTNLSDHGDIEDKWIQKWKNGSAYCNKYSGCAVEVETDLTSTPSFSLSSLKSSTKYYYGVCMCDTQGNCNAKNLNLDFSTKSANTSGDGGGGGGSSGGENNTSVVASSKIVGLWTSIPANEETKWTITSSAIPVDKLSFTFSQLQQNLQIELASFSGSVKPSGVNVTAPNNVYAYLKVTTMATSSVSSANMEFSIPSSWFTTNNYDKDRVRAYRFVNGEWATLYTSIISTTGSEYKYKFDTPGFSYFALTAPNAPPPVAANTGANETIENETTNGTAIVTTTFNISCGDGFCNTTANETCGTCEKDCGVCEISNTTATDQLFGFIDVYYIPMSVIIVLAAIGFSAFYIFVIKGREFSIPAIFSREVPEKPVESRTRQTVLRAKAKGGKAEEAPEPQKPPSKGIPFLGKKQGTKDLRKRPEAFKLE